MTNLLVGAVDVHQDEKAFYLLEMRLWSPEHQQWRRYQMIYVNRGDRLAEYRHDLGPADDFKAQQFRIPGGVYDEMTGRYELLCTVGELRDVADRLRDDKPAVEFELTDLKGQWLDEKEEKRLCARRASTFGSAIKVERN